MTHKKLEQLKRRIIPMLTRIINHQNMVWYVYLSLFLAIIGTGATLWAIFVPITNIQSEIQDLKYDFPKVFNEQTIDTAKLTGEQIIKEYYQFLNSADYQQACSLLSTRMCTLYDVNEFTKWVDDKNRYLTIKLKDGEKLVKVWNSGNKLENTSSEIWCAKISFQMNYEFETVDQIWQYTVANRPDGKKEIRRTLCEAAWKDGNDRSQQMLCNSNPKTCLESKP